jgi:uncharacterized protein
LPCHPSFEEPKHNPPDSISASFGKTIFLMMKVSLSMNCPMCDGVSLVMSERSGVEIDYCPQCRGVWLDRGELDKIIEKSVALSASPVRQDMQRVPLMDQTAYQQPPSYEKSSPHHHAEGHYKKRKSGGFLGELFDFD